MAGYVVPPKVYVGDRASFVLPLPELTGTGDIEIPANRIATSVDFDIHRIALERRPGGSRLIIEFSAYTPGILELPSIEIAGEIFDGLTVEVSSIIGTDISGAVLSPSAPALAMPGTSLLAYGTVSAVILFLTLALWTLLRGRRQIQKWLAAWKRRRLFNAMFSIEKRLRKDLARGEARREIIDTLSVEFRSFLAHLTGKNFRSMTAGEIGGLEENELAGVSGQILGGIFNRGDGIRFSGNEINIGEIQVILDDTRQILMTMENDTRRKTA